MKPSVVAIGLAACAALGAIGYHMITARAQAQIEMRLREIAPVLQQAQNELDGLRRQIVAAQRRAEEPSGARQSARPGGGEVSAAEPKAVLTPAEIGHVRTLRVEAFVSEQRLRFAAFLRRTGLSAEQLIRFDAINTVYQETIADPAASRQARDAAAERRESELRALFGASYAHWQEENAMRPAIDVVTRIVQQTFQSSGALTAAQADELTRIVARHANARVQSGPYQPRYDWDRVVEEAGGLLTAQQLTDLQTAIEYRRASDEMNAIASRMKR
jgi:hypothetical protein